MTPDSEGVTYILALSELAADYAYNGGFSRPESDSFGNWWVTKMWDGVTYWPAIVKDEVRMDLMEWRGYKL